MSSFCGHFSLRELSKKDRIIKDIILRGGGDFSAERRRVLKMSSGYFRRILYLVGLCGLFLHVILRVALFHTPEEEKRAQKLVAEYSITQSGVSNPTDFQYTFYRYLQESGSNNVKNSEGHYFLIETGSYQNEKRLDMERRRLQSQGFSVIKKQVSRSRWVLHIGRYATRQLAEGDLGKLDRLSVRLPKPLRIQSN